MSEVSRITDHLTCLGMAAHEVGASTVSFLMVEGREMLYDLIEARFGRPAGHAASDRPVHHIHAHLEAGDEEEIGVEDKSP